MKVKVIFNDNKDEFSFEVDDKADTICMSFNKIAEEGKKHGYDFYKIPKSQWEVLTPVKDYIFNSKLEEIVEKDDGTLTYFIMCDKEILKVYYPNENFDDAVGAEISIESDVRLCGDSIEDSLWNAYITISPTKMNDDGSLLDYDWRDFDVSNAFQDIKDILTKVLLDKQINNLPYTTNCIKFITRMHDIKKYYAKATARLLFVFYDEYKNRESSFDIPKDRLIINSAWFWDGFKKEQKGIYFNTNVGKIWLCTYNKMWCSSEVNLSDYDLDAVESYLSEKTGLSFKEISKLTKKSYSNLQMEGKI